MSIGLYGIRRPLKNAQGTGFRGFDPSSTYQVLRYRTGQNPVDLQYNSMRRFPVSGDHLFIAEINGSFPVYVRLGEAGLPWIRLRRRMTLSRKFSELWFRTMEPAQVAGPAFSSLYSETDVLVYASWGQLIVDPGEEEALEEGFAAFSSTFGPSPLVQSVLGQLVASSLNPIMFKGGGFLQIVNESLASPFRIQSQAVLLSGLILYPGQCWSVPVSGRMIDTQGTSGGIVIHNQGAAVSYSALFSRYETDFTDIRQSRNLGLI